MTATNHALTGALMGLVIHQPVLAISLAFLSHFVLDAIPHFSSTGDEVTFLRSKRFSAMLIMEALLCFTLVLTLMIRQPQYWVLGSVCAFIATSPDFMWVSRLIAARQKHKLPTYTNPLVRFHHDIQWFARPIGAAVDAAWAIAAIFLLAKLI